MESKPQPREFLEKKETQPATVEPTVEASPEEKTKEFEKGLDKLFAKYSDYFKKSTVGDESTGGEVTFYHPLDSDLGSLVYQGQGVMKSVRYPLTVLNAWHKQLFDYHTFDPMPLDKVEKYFRAVAERAYSFEEKGSMGEEEHGEKESSETYSETYEARFFKNLDAALKNIADKYDGHTFELKNSGMDRTTGLPNYDLYIDGTRVHALPLYIYTVNESGEASSFIERSGGSPRGKPLFPKSVAVFEKQLQERVDKVIPKESK